jgi:glycosyltransferase involved in cell wall biosynthesis
MYADKKVVVVMPAYNAARTLLQTHAEVMAQGVVDLVIVVDDASRDQTTSLAHTLPDTLVHTHPANLGYGGNQKTCYRLALEQGADIVIMVHPDYQYTPKLIPAMASMIARGLYSCVIGSRILGGRAIAGGMPFGSTSRTAYCSLIENVLMGSKLSEYHTGLPSVLRAVAWQAPTRSQLQRFRLRQPDAGAGAVLGEIVAEVSCPTKYFQEPAASTLRAAVRYGIGCHRDCPRISHGESGA